MSLFKRVAAAYKRFTKGGEGFETPDVTRVQQIAFGQAVVAVLIVFGFDVSDEMQELILFVAAALGVALPASDAVIRQSRAKSATQLQQAQQASAEQAASRTIAAGERERLAQLRYRLAALHRRP